VIVNRPALVSGQKQYILVVDSDWNERFTLSMLLQRFGYAIASTNNAREGVEFLCVAPAVAVFAEAGEVGADLTSRLKADARFRDMPLVMVTSRPDRELEERLRTGEFAGLLRTPVSPDEVYRIVQKVVERGSRENIRIPTALAAQVQDEEGVTNGFVTVLSQFGVFFRTRETRPVNARVAVSLSFGDRTISLEAEVLYIVSFEKGPFCEPGMGMKFVNITLEDSALIKFFIYEHLGANINAPDATSDAGHA
jgi:CheY-like chemotaxis protein